MPVLEKCISAITDPNSSSKINKKKFKIVKRPGQIMGAQGVLFHILGDGSTIIILSNTGTTSLDDFAAEIAKKIVQ